VKSHSISSVQNSTPFSGLSLGAAALFLVVVWGTAFNMVDVGVRYLSPAWLVALRLIFAAALMLGYALIAGHKFPPLKDKRWIWYVILGFTGMALPFYLISWAQVNIESGTSAILVGVMPLMTIFLAHYFTTEKLSVRKLSGFFIGLVGTTILFLPDDLSFGLIESWEAQIIALAAAFFYALTTVGAKRAPATHVAVGAAIMTIGAALISTIFALFTDPIPVDVPAIAWWMVAGLAIGSTGIATIVYLKVIERNGPTTLAKINYFPPFVSVLVGIWWLKEPFTARIAIAFALIMLGVWIARNKVSR